MEILVGGGGGAFLLTCGNGFFVEINRFLSGGDKWRANAKQNPERGGEQPAGRYRKIFVIIIVIIIIIHLPPPLLPPPQPNLAIAFSECL